MTQPSAAPGWYPDPSGQPGQRYFDGRQWTTQAPPPPPVPTSPAPKKKWPWIVAGSIVALILVVGLAGGDKDDKKATTGMPSSPVSAGAAPTEKAADKPPPGKGVEVRDGKFAFVVNGVTSGDKVVGREDNQFLQKKAQGEWMVITMTVTNVSDKPQTFFVENQKLKSDGKTFSADSTASLYISDQSLAAEINPGNKIDVSAAYDVPPGTTQDTLIVHDSAFSKGATINLK